MLNTNCWDYMKCGDREKQSCPAYPNCGRVCFVVDGTKCNGGKPSGPYAKKINSCRECGFYRETIISKTV